ncbi:hypothetical protein TPAR_04453 [Tolypocladium paradoxum]|uniref:Uncharacterized protein n=1 Tax=Tolypocladium paradoxum TaxID=94208 RepID=A0A2S4KYT8_9HYPO|nr:hypothetical protein TPAR_04453 [Tolypocladium paradoxum]
MTAPMATHRQVRGNFKEEPGSDPAELRLPMMQGRANLHCMQTQQACRKLDRGARIRQGRWVVPAWYHEADIQTGRAESEGCSLRISSSHLFTRQGATQHQNVGPQPPQHSGTAPAGEPCAERGWREQERNRRATAKLQQAPTGLRGCQKLSSINVGSIDAPAATRAAGGDQRSECDNGWGVFQDTRLFCSAGARRRPELVEIGERLPNALRSLNQPVAGRCCAPVGPMDNGGAGPRRPPTS